MAKAIGLDRQGAALSLIIVASIFVGSNTIGVAVGSFFMFPLRALCLVAVPYALLAIIATREYRDVKLFLILVFSYAITIGLFLYNNIYLEQLSVLQIGISITIMLIGYMNSTNRLVSFFSVWVWGALFVNIISIVEISTGRFLLNEMDKGESFLEGMGFLRPIAIYTNSNNLAFFNCISSIFLLIIITSKSYFSKKLILLTKVVFFLSIVSLIFSYSRAAIGSFIFVFMYFLGYNAYVNRSFKSIAVTVLLIIVGCAVVLITFPSAFEKLLNIFTLFQQKIMTSGKGAGDETRFAFITVSIDKVIENYGFGGGPGFSWNDYHNNRGLVGPHNFLLEIMVDYGVWALIFFLFILFNTYRDLMRGVKKSNARIILSGSIIAFFLLTLTIGSTVGSPVFWVWLGIINIFRILDFEKKRV